MQKPQPTRLVLPQDFAAKPKYEVMPALCLDLDGTVRRSKSGAEFITGPSDVELYPGAEEALWAWRSKGYLLFGLSNQGGVAFGHKTTQDYQRELSAFLMCFKLNPFVAIETAYHMEGGTVFPFGCRSLLRKPHIGMLAHFEETAFASGYVVDWNNSMMVGDRDEDRECAKNAGIDFQWADHFFGREMEGREEEL